MSKEPALPRMNEERVIDAMAEADCVPLDILLCILTRLPVKSLLRFKSVCKTWYEEIADPRFMKMHHDQFSDHPGNQYFIIHSLSAAFRNRISLLNIESNATEPTNLEYPEPEFLLVLDFVGCWNGLVCMRSATLGMPVVLWNPATKMCKLLRHWVEGFRFSDKASIGLGYEPYLGDFKVVRIVCAGSKEGFGVEVCSCNSDSCEKIELDFQFEPVDTKNDVIVNGNPYWVAKLRENWNVQSQLGEKVLVWFDVKNMKFNIVPLLSLDLKEGDHYPFVDWNGSVGAILCNKNKEMVGSFDVWVLDKGQKFWTKNHTFGPIEMTAARFLQCSNNGKKLVGQFSHDRYHKPFVFDPETGFVKKIVLDERPLISLWVQRYSEGLAYVKGMIRCLSKKEDEKEDEEAVEDFLDDV